MTRKSQRGPGMNEAPLTSRHHAAESDDGNAPAVVGVVELMLRDVTWANCPAGAVVRVQLGDDRWPDPTAISHLASATLDVRRLEITGPNPRTIADVVATVRRLHADYQRDWDAGTAS